MLIALNTQIESAFFAMQCSLCDFTRVCDWNALMLLMLMRLLC